MFLYSDGVFQKLNLVSSPVSTCKMAPFGFVLVVLLLGASRTFAASFAYSSGNRLYADGRPFYHLGVNAYWMPATASFGPDFIGRVDQVLDAAQRLGLRVVRAWAFNDKFPSRPGVYDAVQGKGLDYFVAGAGRRGIRVELALANFWPAYLGPEVWLAWAEGSSAGKTIADFYRSQGALKLLQDHIHAITGRVNTITGVAYKDDPAIIGYNLFNEPRCPGCSGEDIAARNSFISSLASTLRGAAPKQLAFSGTEGYFAPGDANVVLNPGAGSQCEGESWTQEIQSFDVATTHIYYRQVEEQVALGWRKMDFDSYIQFLNKKLQLYTDIAGGAGRPLVIEEFGLSRRFYGDEEMKVVVAVVADALIAAKRAGKPLMGAWLWEANPPGEADVGGYDVYMTRSPSGASIGLGGATATASGSITTNASSSSTGSTSTSVDTSKAKVGRRRLSQLVVKGSEDYLDGFRRATARGACAHSAAYGWRMSGIPQTVDVVRYRAMVRGHDMVDILAEAARLLNA